jgi:hypothetical protein
VRLVQVQVALVLLLDGDDLGQVDDGALHAVDACAWREENGEKTITTRQVNCC